MNLKTSTAGSKLGDKLGMGCLALFALPFAGVGIFTAYKAVESLFQGKIKEGLFFTVFALVFGGVGFGMLAGVFFGSKFKKRLTALQIAHPEEPWLWRADWASGRIAASDKSTALGLWVFAAFWNFVADSAFLTMLKEGQRHSKMAWLVLIFPLVGIGLIIAAVRATLRWKKFGQSWFKLLNNPGVIGGQLAGAIETSVKLRPEGGFQLHLRCIDRDSSGENTSEHVRWEDQKTIIKDMLDDPRRSGIPVFFQIPGDCSPTDESVTNHKTIWRLEVRAKVEGTDYQARFEVPVFKTEITNENQPAVDPTLPYQAPVEPYERPANSRIKIRTLNSGVTEFYFPAGRNIGATAFLCCFTAVWSGAVWFMIAMHAPILFPIVFGLFDLLFLLVLAGMLFKSSRIAIGSYGLNAQQNWTLFKTNRQFAQDNIKALRTKVGMSHGQTRYYDLQLVTRQNPNPRFANAAKLKRNPEWGCTLTLATALRDKKEAEWLAAEMLRLLKIDNSRATPTLQP